MANTCKYCGEKFAPKFKTTEQFCSFTCANKAQKKQTHKKRKRIPYRTPKREAEEREYVKLRREFLDRPENKFCFVNGCNRRATTVEHTRGRVGAMLLKQEYWKPCCLEHNLEFERNPELSKQYQKSKLHGGSKI